MSCWKYLICAEIDIWFSYDPALFWILQELIPIKKTQRNVGALSIITHKRQLIQLGNDSNNHQCPSSVNSRSPQPPPFPSFFSNNRTLPSGDCPFNLRYNYTTKTLWDSENDSDLIRVAKCHRYDRYIRLKIFVVIEVTKKWEKICTTSEQDF